jgi:membrane protein required for colicin V production
MAHGFNFIDYFILIVIGISVLLGFIHGFIRMVLSVLVWVAAFFISAFYGPHLATTFSLVTSDPKWQLWLSYGSVFVVAVVVGFVVKLILNLILTGGGVSVINRFLGALFGAVRGAIIIVLFAWFALLVGMNQTAAFQASRLMPFFQNLLSTVETMFPSVSAAAQSALSSLSTNQTVQSATQATQQGKSMVQSGVQQVKAVTTQTHF